MGVLYPGSQIAVVSGTAEQATLVLKKIDDYFVRNQNILREIDSNGHKPVQLSRSKGICHLKNGSIIESYSMGTFRGARAKIIVIDEAPEVKKQDLEAIVRPVRNTTRSVCIQNGFDDYESKMISITSACLKSNYFYDAFVDTMKQMASGDRSVFACALDYRAAIRCGISKEDFFEQERKTMTQEKFAMEYGSIFIGAESGSVFPYELTERCRVLRDVEIAMPSKSNSEYVMGVDLATSDAAAADNAVISIIKLVENEDGSYIRKLVYMRSFHGKRLDALAIEVRKLLVKFPNTSKVVFDYRGLGDAFPRFFAQPWTDPDSESHREYPPLVLDTEPSMIHGAVPLLHPCIANNTINQQMVSAVTIALEKETLEIPVPGRRIIGNTLTADDEAKSRKLVKEEMAIFYEADALQIEMGNIVGRETGSGAVIYDTARSTQHKDRYSSIGMALLYIAGMEDYRVKRQLMADSVGCIGIVTKF